MTITRDSRGIRGLISRATEGFLKGKFLTPFIAALLGASCVLIHLATRFQWYSVNALVNQGLREGGNPVNPIPYWLFGFLGVLSIFFLLALVDRRFFLKVDPETFNRGLAPVVVGILLFVPVDVVVSGEFVYKNLTAIPAIALSGIFAGQSLLIRRVLQEGENGEKKPTLAAFKVRTLAVPAFFATISILAVWATYCPHFAIPFQVELLDVIGSVI
ncbi:MAG: hypothetical protein ACTSU5_21165 [Promethearchaeota archaeon]